MYFSLTGALVNKWLAFKGSFFNDVGEFNKIKLWICIIILYFLLRIVLVMIKMKNGTLFLEEVCIGGDGTNAVFYQTNCLCK